MGNFPAIATILQDCMVAVLPSQLMPFHRWRPEQWLWAALLADCAHAMQDAEERKWCMWWLNGGQSDAPFDVACMALELDPASVRKALLRRYPVRDHRTKARALA